MRQPVRAWIARSSSRWRIASTCRALRASLQGMTDVTARPWASTPMRLCQNAAMATASTRVVTRSSAPSIASATVRSMAAGAASTLPSLPVRHR